MKNKFNPGPWIVNSPSSMENTVCFDHGAGLCALAIVEPVIISRGSGQIVELINEDQARANATLIAAAPELLEAVEKALEAINEQRLLNAARGNPSPSSRHIINAEAAMHRAVRKARGES